MTDLSGKVIVVTGAAQGLGRAYAERLGDLGGHVVVADIEGGAAGDAATALSDRGNKASAAAVDVSSPSEVERMVRDIEATLGPVSILVNNAGGAFFPPTEIEAFAPDDWSRVLGVNLTGTWLCSRAVVPGMKRAGAGKVINVSSTTTSRGYPIGLAPYMAAKGGVVALTRALAQELGPSGITVNAIAPGYTPVQTKKNVHSPEGASALRERMVSEQCLKRTETPHDLCGAIEFLASDLSDFVTGQVLNVDGGWAFD